MKQFSKMENFNEYWELFVDRKDSIAKEIIAYYKTLDDHEDGTELSEQCRKFLRKNMIQNPYPTCQLLKLLAMSKLSSKNSIIYEIAVAAVLEAFEQKDQQIDRNKCYNILANSLISVKATNSIKMCILRALERKTVDLEMLMLAIFSRKSVKFIVHLLPELVVPLGQQQAWDAFDGKRHFFNAMLKNNEFPFYKHHANYIRFIEQVLLANSGVGTFSSAVEQMAPLTIDKKYLTAYLLEMQRCYLIQKVLNFDETLLPPKDLSQHATVMGMMLRAKVNLNEADCTKLLAVIRTNRTLNEQIMGLTNAASSVESSEVMALLQIQSLCMLYKAIETAAASPECALIATSNLDTQLKCLLKEMDMRTFMQTIESIFTMLFVRGELISTEPERVAERKHFLCSVPLLATLTSSLKSIMIARKHSATYHDASELLKHRFQTLFELVTDVCWRLSLFDEPVASSEGTPLDPECARALHLIDMPPVPTTLTHITENYCDSSSSGSAKLFRSVESIAAIDVANGQRHRYGYYGTLPKHKSSRRQTRHPLAANVSSNSGGSNKDLQRQGSLSVDTKTESIAYDRNAADGDLAGGSMRSILWNKTNFTKLFATPETLAVVCLTNSRMNFAKQIIETHNLQDQPVGKLVERIEQMQTLKNDLATLIKKNEQKQETAMGFGGTQSSDSNNSDVLLDDIRLKTAMGFEISKVLSTLETFLKSQPLSTEEVLAPIDRFVSRYPFLGVLTGKNLQLSQIVDIILNLPFSYELNLAIYNFLLKNSHHMANIMVSSMMSSSIAGHGGETSQWIGNYVSFFGTIMDTLQISHKTARARLNVADFKLTISELLSREVCPLDTVENGIVLKRRARFYSMIERSDELDDAENLDRSFALLTDSGSASLAKVKLYMEHLTKLLQSLLSGAKEDTGSDHRDLTEVNRLIQTDVQKLMLKRLAEKRTSFVALDTLGSMLGINLVQTLGKRILEPKDEAAGALQTIDGLWEFIASKSELLCQLCKVEADCFKPVGRPSSLIVNYSELVRAAAADLLQHMPNGCSHVRASSVPQTELFPLEVNRPCCMLQQKQGKYFTKVELVMLGANDASMEHKALALLANVNGFSVANEWISASEHLLAAIPKNLDREERCDIMPATRQQLQQKANELRTYLRIGTILQLSTDGNDPTDGDGGWQRAQRFSTENKSTVLHQLIEQGEYRVCADWIKLHPIDAEAELEMFIYAVHKVSAVSTVAIIPTDPQDTTDVPIVWLFRIIETMPIEAVAKLYETIMLNIRSVAVVRYMLEYLQRYTATKPLYQKYQLSLKIFEHLAREEYDGLWNLASRPLLIIEQCLMNSRLELLAAVMRSIRGLLVADVCTHCYEHREYIRDLHDAVQSGPEQQPHTTGVRRYPVHDELFISHECVDCLLRVYAGKALEYKVFPADTFCSADAYNDDRAHALGAVSRVSSYDSLSEVDQPFVMPKDIPTRDRWVKDEEALHCMCCRRTFSMLNRRHHCRRCGRVVCHSCSKKKLRLQSFYEDVAVRVCDDCWRNLAGTRPADTPSEMGPAVPSGTHARTSEQSGSSQFEWQLTGNERYDSVIRDEYSYEYAPSTNQCLAISNLHTANEEMASFLLYHCAKLEALLRPLHPGVPNPEIDYALVARMLLNLTLGVKVRGGGAEVEKMKEHAEIILSIVHDNCESLLLHTPSNMTNHGSLRKLRDALVKAEKWTLALELSLKCGFSLNGVMAAWGMACLRAGCYETAREKFSHCLPRVATDAECEAVLRMIELPPMSNVSVTKVPIVKRPARCPPLLNEILYALTYTARLGAPSERVIARVNAARQVTAGSVTGGSHEPAVNILSTLANLRHICLGEFDGDIPGPNAERLARHDNASLMCSQLFEESMHYLLAYGSHQSVVQFLMRYQQTEVASLRYILAQRVDPDVFLHAVLLPYLQRGELETVVQRLSDIDDTLLEWRDHIRYACRYLETNDMLNSLYSLQLLLKDPIRASMTCVRFYTMGCRTFGDLHASEHHLKTSVSHLQNELELCNWQEVRHNSTIDTHHSLLMKLDPKELNNHINTILLQLDVTKFLATCEAKGRQTVALLPKIFRETSQLPTLFGSCHDKLQLAILTLVCGQNVEEAFGLSYRIIQDYNLDLQRVYALTAKYFINHGKIEDVGKLLDVIVSNEGSTGDTTEPTVTAICDEIVRVSVDVAITRHGTGVHTKVALETLINRASSVAVRIHCYIVSGQLKAAYLLANRHQRTGDIRKILRQAELLGQMHVKRLCEARLNHAENNAS